MNLNQLEKPPGSTRKPKRKGRGHASTLGKTAGRGQKGQKSRGRGKVARGFEGGQTPLRRRLPRRGFKNPFKTRFHIVNLIEFTRRPALAEKSIIAPEDLIAANVIRITNKEYRGEGDKMVQVRVPRFPVKVLGQGELDRAVTIHAHQFSRSALEKIQAAGGEAVVIEA